MNAKIALVSALFTCIITLLTFLFFWKEMGETLTWQAVLVQFLSGGIFVTMAATTCTSMAKEFWQGRPLDNSYLEEGELYGVRYSLHHGGGYYKAVLIRARDGDERLVNLLLDKDELPPVFTVKTSRHMGVVVEACYDTSVRSIKERGDGKRDVTLMSPHRIAFSSVQI